MLTNGLIFGGNVSTVQPVCNALISIVLLSRGTSLTMSGVKVTPVTTSDSLAEASKAVCKMCLTAEPLAAMRSHSQLRLTCSEITIVK